MKAIEVGKYLIRVSSNQSNVIELKEENVLALSEGNVCIFDSSLYFNQYDAVFYVHLLENNAELVVIFDRDNHENNGKIFYIHVGEPFLISSIEFEIVFECAENNLENAIYAFKNNLLIGDYDIKSLLVQYAKVNGITDKQAVCYIVTTIDVPEIEK